MGAFVLLLAAGVCDVYAAPSQDQTKKSGTAASPSENKSVIPENYNCITCHIEIEDEILTPPVANWKKSVHREAGIKCADCHGGDPFDEDMAMEPEAGYIGKPKPEDIPKLCAKCHSDAKMMRAYNQRADQYQLYSGSVHGRKLLSGDTEAPTCISCHGKHKILRVKDPDSMAFRRNVPEMCGGCHSRKEIFEKRGKPFNQLALYKKSWHYEKFTKGDLLTPTCENCHSNHGIIPPKSERVQTVCFNCHASEAEFYKDSPHWNAYKKDGEPICLNCHNYHDIERPTIAKFTGDRDIDCVECHEKSGKAYKVGVEIQSMMLSAISVFQKASNELKDFKDNAHGGFEVSGITKKMEKTADMLKELNALAHKLDIGASKKQSEGITKTAEMVSETVDQMWGEIKMRNIGLVTAWVVFLGFSVTLWIKTKSLKQRGEDD